MKYLLLIYSDEAVDAKKTPEELQDEMNAYMSYSNQGRKAGVILGGEPLHPTSSAKTVRVRDGKMLTTDGPFAETKEQLGGFYLVDCASVQQALEWASRIPHASSGSIEVRPVMDF